jgi:dTDP-4-amino-4,6-dideoxygalactose transaminase
MINYISDKIININLVSEYLKLSKNEKKYTNNGPVKKLLELKLEQLLELNDNKKVLCLSNGTAALQAVMFLCKKKGIKKWAIPAYTFPSALVGNIFNVEIFDISKDTYTLDLNKIVDFDGVILTNLFGTYSNIKESVDFCEKHNITLVYDNAASPLSKYKGINICNFGDYCIGSLHHTKYLGYGEGGFIVCNKTEYDILNSISNFGYPNYSENKNFASNFKMSDISAAFILTHIENFNIDNYLCVQNKLIQAIGIENIFNYNEGIIYNSFPVLFKAPINIDYYSNEKITVNKYYKPLIDSAINSKYIYERIINLPLYGELTNKQIKKIIKLTLNRIDE